MMYNVIKSEEYIKHVACFRMAGNFLVCIMIYRMNSIDLIMFRAEKGI